MPAIIRESAYEEHDNYEKRVYVHWINRNLFNRDLLSRYLPLNPSGEEIFDKINDGVIFCETINEIFPNSIDMNVLVIGFPTDKEDSFKNLMLAFETARSYGCQLLDLRFNDIFSGVRQSILELFWQIFYVGLVNSINYENFPEIEILKNENESIHLIKTLKPEEIIVRFVNYHIKLNNPSAKGMESFKDSLKDGTIYCQLVDSIAQQRGIDLVNDTSTILKERNEKVRFDMLHENFNSIKIQGFILDNVLLSTCSEKADYKIHKLTMAMFFHKFGVDAPRLANKRKMEFEDNVERETNLEKLCRIFLNSISVKPIITNLKHDCKDGLVFAQVMKQFLPDLFKKDKFIEEFDSDQIESKMIHNAAIIKNRFDKFHHVPINDFHAEYMQAGKRKVVCGIVYNFMIHWVLNSNVDVNNDNDNLRNNINENDEEGNRKFSEKDLILWVNSLSNEYQINSFRDGKIIDKKMLAKVIDCLFPNSIDWTYLNNLTNKKLQAIYCVNVARRLGFPMFIHPDMIASGDYRCTLLAFLILKEKMPIVRSNVCPE